MHHLRRLSRLPSACLAFALVFLGLPMPSHGLMMDTPAVLAFEQVAIDRATLAATLERADVQRQLVALGVDVQQAKERVGALSAEEVAALNGKIDQLPAGGDALALVVLVFLVLLFTDIAGYTDIFPFVKKHR